MDGKRPDNIPGYIHPDDNTYSRSNIYKTYSDNGPKPGYGYSLPGGACYATMSFDEQVSENCPQCGKQAVILCNCVYNEKTCEDGHTWYTDREGNTKFGNPH